jgi:predicted trehalose synthase
MPSRRLEDRIRQLCAKAASAPASEVGAVLEELKAALEEHTKRLRQMAANKLVHGDGWKEKRSR